MPVRIRDLGSGICYIFNGRDFIVNKNLPAADCEMLLARCRENEPPRSREPGPCPSPQSRRERPDGYAAGGRPGPG